MVYLRRKVNQPMRLRWKIAQLAEAAWWQRYLKNKPKAEYLAWKRKYWLEMLQKLGLYLAADARVLDAGCGPAGVFIALPTQHVTAADPLLEAYEEKLTHFRRDDYPAVRFWKTPLEDLPIEAFDWVFCLNVINHVANIEGGTDKLVACLAPEGKLVISVDAHNYGVLKHIFRWFQNDILHPHQFDLAEYQAMLTSRGLQIEQTVLFKRERIFNYYVMVASRTALT